MKFKVYAMLLLLMTNYCYGVPNHKFIDDYYAVELYQTHQTVVIGNPLGSITVVEFFDYFCAPCRIMAITLAQLASTNHNLRIVAINYPLLGPKAIFAAKAALAAQYQGKFLTLNHAMINAKKPLSHHEIFSLAQTSALNLKKLQKDMDGPIVTQDLLNNLLLGNAFGVKQLPAVVIGYTRAPHHTTLYANITIEKLMTVIKHMSPFTKGRSNLDHPL